MAADLQGRRVAILAADGVERVELEQPREALDRAGARTEVLSVGEGEIQARDNDLDPAGTFSVDGLVAEASVADYDALVLPGGTVNPDKLRVEQDAVAFVRDFVESGKPVAAICHGPWTLIEAGVVTGRTLTSFPSIRTDLRNAGANVLDLKRPGFRSDLLPQGGSDHSPVVQPRVQGPCPEAHRRTRPCRAVLWLGRLHCRRRSPWRDLTAHPAELVEAGPHRSGRGCRAEHR